MEVQVRKIQDLWSTLVLGRSCLLSASSWLSMIHYLIEILLSWCFPMMIAIGSFSNSGLIIIQVPSRCQSWTLDTRQHCMSHCYGLLTGGMSNVSHLRAELDYLMCMCISRIGMHGKLASHFCSCNASQQILKMAALKTIGGAALAPQLLLGWPQLREMKAL